MTTKTTTNVTFGDISTQVSNKDAAGKEFNISANAKINDGNLIGLEGGSFYKAEGNGNGWFGFGTDKSFNFGCNGLDEVQIESAVKAIVNFYNDVKVAVNAKNAE